MRSAWFFALILLAVIPGQTMSQMGAPAATPAELVATYENLADVILGAKASEKQLVLSILATTYGHAEAAYARTTAEMQAGMDVKPHIERLATFVSHLGNEGDASVAAVRKRLLEGGHHHNAEGERQGIYDPGFVVVTRSAKAVFLGAARNLGRLAGSPNAQQLREEWEKVKKEYQSLTQ